ncbi:MAG: hypothetical protein HDS04_05940 [Bacteroides sp.]|nr:hypothetical protein [Bacteroides sp.]
MTLSQTLKAIVIGFCFGVGIVWLLTVILTIAMGVNPTEFIRDCREDISSMSVLSGGISSVCWPLVTSISRKRRKREELEDAMTEFFRKQAKKED